VPSAHAARAGVIGHVGWCWEGVWFGLLIRVRV